MKKRNEIQDWQVKHFLRLLTQEVIPPQPEEGIFHQTYKLGISIEMLATGDSVKHSGPMNILSSFENALEESLKGYRKVVAKLLHYKTEEEWDRYTKRRLELLRQQQEKANNNGRIINPRRDNKD